MSVRPPRRSRLRRLTATAAGVVLALAVGELAARVLVPAYAERVPAYEIESVSTAPPSWVYMPGSTVSFTWDGDPIGVLPEGAHQSVRINAAGLRGPPPVPGTAPVVFLGDSFTFGEGVAEADTFCSRVGTALKAAVVDAGVAGQDTPAVAVRLPGLLAAVRPRAVVYVFVPNDAIVWSDSADLGSDLLNTPTAPGSRLIALVRGLVATHDVEDWYRSYYTGERAAGWQRARAALADMATRCRERGVPFGVAAFPLLHRLHAYPFADIHATVRAACDELHVPFLDLAPVFAGRDESELWAHPADHHPNRRAHALAAEALTPFVRDLAR